MERQPVPHLNPDAIIEAVVNRLRGSSLADKSVGFGTPEHGQPVGKMNAVWSAVVGKDGDVEVPHNLGAVPVTCELVEWHNAADRTMMVVANAVDKSKWTATTCRVHVHQVSGAGTLSGTTLTFRVGGK